MQEIVYHTNYQNEDSYWWFTARNIIISKIIKKIIPSLSTKSQILDIGCGTGGFASYISKDYDISCLDTSKTALEYCQKRGLKKLYNNTIAELPDDIKPFDAAIMLDVLEHIEDDKSALEDVYNILDDNGYYIMTVPAYKWMWSKHDEIHMHYRRYTKKEVLNKIKDAGFDIKYSSYFNSILFLPAFIKRKLDKITGKEEQHKDPVDKVSDGMNKLFHKLFSFESNFLPAFSFPYGLSIIVIAQKTGK